MLEKYERVYAAVDLSAALYNMERMHEAVSPQTKMIGVIRTATVTAPCRSEGNWRHCHMCPAMPLRLQRKLLSCGEPGFPNRY